MRKKIYKPLGFVFLTLAALGVVLPVLPTTPFLLLAAWLFARSSPRWHRKLLNSDMFGSLLRNWEQQRCLTRRTKLSALLMMSVVGGSSIWFALEDPRLQLFAGSLIAIGCVTVLGLKTCPACKAHESVR